MAETITREQATKELLEHYLDDIASDDKWLKQVFTYGWKGFAEMDIEELQDEYNDIFDNEEDKIIITEK